jgi:hypothetical protein
VLVADAYNLSYSGGRDQEGDQEDWRPKPAQANVVLETLS